jgi:aryl-alcohol dehydrogenase-like predicted oxidoreductase/enamine deaminase RidA (YjgF/YER057c/UK114 family)
MSTTSQAPVRQKLAPDLEISRLVTGLWQVADLERGGQALDPEIASSALLDYAQAGFDTFDMADHYGSAEIITGRLLKRYAAGELPNRPQPAVFTKWCPTPGPMTRQVVREGIERSLRRLDVSSIELLQFHWWSVEHPAYLDAMKELAALQAEGIIRHLGVTNFDTMHLRVLVKHGIPVLTNQVSFSVLDRRAAEEMTRFCLEHGVRLLAYGTLGGGLVSERWRGAPEPDGLQDWSKMKYKRFIDQIGGWAALQGLLEALSDVAKRHGVSIPNVATRWVLDHPAVAGVIIGARLGEREHRSDNLNAFSFELDAADHERLQGAMAHTRAVPGDCGDEYRRPPFLTASGDLSHHLAELPRAYAAEPVNGTTNRWRVSSGSVWEPLCGYSRAIRVGERVIVSGTTATNGTEEVVCRGDAAGQATFILDKIAASLAALGARLEDVVSTRVYLQHVEDWAAVSRVHGRFFGTIRPANVLLAVNRLVGDYRVEIEAEAVASTDVRAQNPDP